MRWPLPLTVEKWAYLEIERPVTPHEWDRLLHLLEVLKPGFVQNPCSCGDGDCPYHPTGPCTVETTLHQLVQNTKEKP